MARRRLIGDLTEAGVYEATACDAGLVISELISNALRHATPLPGSTVRVSWRLDEDGIEVAVSDGGGPTVPAVNQPGLNAIGGRGLGIVDRLAQRWGVYTDPEGAGETTVWALLALHCDEAADSAGVTASPDHNIGQAMRLVTASTRDA